MKYILLVIYWQCLWTCSLSSRFHRNCETDYMISKCYNINITAKSSVCLCNADALIVLNSEIDIIFNNTFGCGCIEITIESSKISNIAARAFAYGYDKLTKLFISNNKIVNMSATAFDGLHQLQHLQLQNNNLKFLPLGLFADLPALKDLDLSYNDLDSLPLGLFTGLSNLQSLNSIPSALFVSLRALQELNLSHNNLTYLKYGTFAGLTSLVSLNISQTNFKRLNSRVFFTLNGLKRLDISNASLEFIEIDNIMNKFPRLNYLRFFSNNLNYTTCNDLVNLLDKLKKRYISFSDGSNTRETNIHGFKCMDSYDENSTIENSTPSYYNRYYSTRAFYYSLSERLTTQETKIHGENSIAGNASSPSYDKYNFVSENLTFGNSSLINSLKTLTNLVIVILILNVCMIVYFLYIRLKVVYRKSLKRKDQFADANMQKMEMQ